MKEVRVHGRGGQGAVIGTEMLAYAIVLEKRYASSIPSFGVERRGAPVRTFLRFDDKFIRDTHLIYDPDCVVVLDSAMARTPDILEGLKGDGIVILNATDRVKFHNTNVKSLGLLDATGIALEEIGMGISNTCMMGAFAKITGWVKLESVIASLEMHFKGELLRRNSNAARRGFEDVELIPLNRG